MRRLSQKVLELSCQKLSLAETGAFPELFLEYISGKEKLKPFYNQFPTLENFEHLIAAKDFDSSHREILVTELEKQYATIPTKPDFYVLREANTFTVTTGHQLNIFTGPLYVIFKIVATINLAKRLKAAYPAYHFVPVYWMATEDHDLEEIQSLRAFGEKHIWQTAQKGAVGRMNTESLAQMAEKLGKTAGIFEKAYRENETLAAAVRAYMHTLFGQYGLVCLDADSRALKAEFQAVIRDDIEHQTAFGLVNKQTQALEKLGYHTQIKPREINFFYLDKNQRERLVFEEGAFKVLHSDLQFSFAEISELIVREPERFSPNVVLRPLFQEMILPNLAYIGGPSEIPYWLQLKPVFDHYGVRFPALIPRNFALLLNQQQGENWAKMGFEPADLFKTTTELEKIWLHTNSAEKLELSEAFSALTALYTSLKSQAKSVDPTLQHTAEAFESKSVDLLNRLEKKLFRAEKRKHIEAIQKIARLKEILFPEGGLQERKENIIPFLEQNPDLIENLIRHFDPLDYRFHILHI